jgi:chemotaxis signal transduction protein
VALPSTVAAPVTDRLVCFSLGGQPFGLPIRAVKETLPMRPITRVFLVPRVVAGLINLRGEVVAVLDLAELVGLPPPNRDARDSAIVILRTPEGSGARGGGRAACGVVVERLLGVRELPGPLLPPPPTLESEAASYLSGVAAGGEPPSTLGVLDPERVLAAEPLKPFRRRKA